MNKIYNLMSISMLIIFSIPVLAQNNDCQTRNQNYRSLRNVEIVQKVDQPFTSQEIAKFQGLFYYPIDCQALFTGKLYRNDPMKVINVETTKGEMVSVYNYGTVVVQIGEEEYSLEVYQNIDFPDFAGAATVFIPIKDETSGKSTFKDGRYLIIEPAGNEVVLDLNMAINPWENYNNNYSTMLVPASNVIRGPVQTGERKYEDR
jgi:uncharacterized protein (DUF1684 family)